MKTILVSIDFSPVSQAVIAQAAALAKLDRARIILLYIVPQKIPAAEDYGASAAAWAHGPAISADDAAGRLLEWSDKLAYQGLRAEILVEEGNPSQRIVAAAEKARASLIMLGSHGHTALYDLVMGGTADGVLRRARCPIVIVPDPGKTAASQPTPEVQPCLETAMAS